MNRKRLLEEIFEEFERFRRNFSAQKRRTSCFKDLTPVQWQIVVFISKKGPSSPTELASHLGISKSAVSQQLDSLEAKGFASATIGSPDKRKKVYFLTDKAQSFINKARSEVISALRESFSSFTDDELSQFLYLLKKLSSKD